MNENSTTMRAFPMRGFTVFCALVLPSVPCAHPGHDPGETPPSHLLLNPDRLGVLLVVSVILFCFVRALRWRKGLSS